MEPIIILGAPRTGTALLARVIGSCPDVFLITEHSPTKKPTYCPEDRSGIRDADLWWKHFRFNGWNGRRPICERPVFDIGRIESMRDRYLQMAAGRRLVIKNPLHIARVDMLKLMFPKALFVFSLRAPWATIASATKHGKNSFIVNTDFVNSLPDDLCLRAAATWAQAIDIWERERDHHWTVVRHELLVENPLRTVAQLYAKLELDPVAITRAARLPTARAGEQEIPSSPYASWIDELISHRAVRAGYSGFPVVA